MSEENKAALDRANEILNGADVDLVDEVFSEDFVEHNPMPGAGSDREGFRQMVQAMRAAFPDFRTEVHHQVAEGDYVVEHWTSSGTHQSEFFGVPPTGNVVSIEGMDLSRLADGKIVEHWTQMDSLGMMQQLGVIPDEAPA